MEVENKEDEISSEEKTTVEEATPIVTRSMVEDACPTCGARSLPCLLCSLTPAGPQRS